MTWVGAGVWLFKWRRELNFEHYCLLPTVICSADGPDAWKASMGADCPRTTAATTDLREGQIAGD